MKSMQQFMNHKLAILKISFRHENLLHRSEVMYTAVGLCRKEKKCYAHY